MNDVKNRLAIVLADAESGVLEVIAAAAASGDYATIDSARAVAGKLRDIIRNIDKDVINGPNVVDSARPVSKQTQRKKRKTTPKRGEYPRFNVADGSLFKIGWSKKKGAEYLHRVPISTVRDISRALEPLSASLGPVSSEKILESDSLKDAGNPPSYQVYIVLAYLKERGIIASTGREGFRFSSDVASHTSELLRQEADAASE